MKTLSLALLLLPLSAIAATLRVNNTPATAPGYSTIQAAINAAVDGDTLLIEGSTTPYDAFTITGKRLNLIGPGYRLSGNANTPANKLGAVVQNTPCYIRQTGTTGTLIMGLEFGYDLILDGCSGVTVARCLFNSYSGRLNVNGPACVVIQNFFEANGTNVSLTSAASGARIENNILRGTPSASGSFSTPPVLTFRNNLFANSSPVFLYDVNVTFENNIFNSSAPSPSAFPGAYFRNNIFPSSLPPDLNGSGNLGPVNLSTVMPAYQDSYASFDGRYKLATASNPALNAGTDGTHIGPFGGANPYILSGIPPLPTIDELSAPQFASPGSTLTIRVKVSERP